MPTTDPNVFELEKELGRTETPTPEGEDKNPSRWADPWVRRAAVSTGVLLVIAVVALLVYYHNRVSTDGRGVDGTLFPLPARFPAPLPRC